jgi:hypothetical protein
MWRNFARVVASGTCSCMRSMCMNLCMARRVEDGILRALVREAEHDLEQVHPEHRLGAADMPAALLGVVMGSMRAVHLSQGTIASIRSRNSSRLVFLRCPCDSRSPKLIWLPMPASRSCCAMHSQIIV